jgi:hypothetical protein
MTPISPETMIENEGEAEDCPICLDEMSPADLAHPLRCQTRCGYNFCLTCIESLITSSKDDYEEASDGNMHVKIFLNCPNCRSDLGSSIRDTLLCRKVYTLNLHANEQVDLTASERRLKQVIHDPEVQLAVKEAQKREDEFFGRAHPKSPQALDENNEVVDDTSEAYIRCHKDSLVANYKEMGVEADVDFGVHQSFVISKNRPAPIDKRTIDPTLFQGLEFGMSNEEKETVTELLTSGDTTKLAGAAEILHGISLRVQQGLPPPKPVSELPEQQVSRSSSIYKLIDESKAAREIAYKKTVQQTKALYPQQVRRQLNQERRLLKHDKFVNHRKVDMELAQRAQFMKLHPLPVRMPKYVEFNLHDKQSRSFLPFFLTSANDNECPLSFIDDTWDGSVIDAFCKISVTGGKNPVVTKKMCENVGVVNILESGGDDTDDWIDTENNRVLVASVRSEAGRQGVLKGDVVTHFNGELFDGTAADLDAVIKAQAERSGNGMFTLVLNAESSVAEALRRRSMI